MEQRIRLEPYGCWTYELSGKHRFRGAPDKRLKHLHTDLKTLWGHSSEIAMVNSLLTHQLCYEGKPYTPADIISAFPFLARNNPEIYWARKWPGTTLLRGTRALLAKCAISGLDFEEFARHRLRLFWQGPGRWEDLMLLEGNKLIFYVCSHEQLGAIYGPNELFSTLGVRPTKLYEQLDLAFEVAVAT